MVKRAGWGKKREHMVGTFAGSWTPRPIASRQSVTIIGAGIAGQSLALAASAAGLPVTLHGTGAPPQGSGVPLALVNYRPSGDRGPLGHLSKAAFFAAQQAYGARAFASFAPDQSTDRDTGDVQGHDRPLVRFGVEALVSDDRLRARWDRETDVEHQWIDDSMDRVLVPGAFSLDTAGFRRAVLARVACVPDAINGPQALNRIVAEAPPGALTLIAAGLGSPALLSLADSPLGSLRPNRGQQDEVRLEIESADDSADALRRPLNFGRLLLPQTGSDRAWLGASFDRDPPEDWQAPRSATVPTTLSGSRRRCPRCRWRPPDAPGSGCGRPPRIAAGGAYRAQSRPADRAGVERVSLRSNPEPVFGGRGPREAAADRSLGLAGAAPRPLS